MATSSSFALKARSWIDCTATDYVHKQSIGESPAASHQNVQARVARSGIEGMMRGMRRAYNLRVPSGYPKVPWFTSIGGLPAVCIAKKGRYRVQASSSNADNVSSEGHLLMPS